MLDATQQQQNRLGDIFAELHQLLDQAADSLLPPLQEAEPDGEAVRFGLLMLEALRDGSEESVEIRRKATSLRDQLVAGIYRAAPEMKVRDLANAAGYGDSYVARVARKNGVPPRTVRPRRQDAEADAEADADSEG